MITDWMHRSSLDAKFTATWLVCSNVSITIRLMRTLRSGEFFGEADRMTRVSEHLSAGVIRHDPGLTLPKHQHELARICIVLSGTMAEKHQSDYEEFASDWVLFWPPGVVHEDQFGSSIDNRTLQIEFSRSLFAEKIVRYFPATSPSPLPSAVLDDAVPKLCAELLRGDTQVPIAIEAAVYDLIARSSRARGSASPLSFHLQRAIAYIDEHLGDGVRPADLAAALSVTTGRLNRIFQTELGSSVTHTIRMRRVRCAQKMLRDTTLSIAGLAAQLGYYDSAHMARDFRRLIGATPSSFRQAITV
jgi:AraC family transcriptional regulator